MVNTVISCTFAGPTSLLTYTGPFSVVRTSTIAVTAFLLSFISQETHVMITTLTVKAIDRSACVTDVHCPFPVASMYLYWHVALFMSDGQGEKLSTYQNETYGFPQISSSSFSGALDIGEGGSALFFSHSQVGHLMSSSAKKAGAIAEVAVNLPVYSEVALSPSEVANTQKMHASVRCDQVF